MVLPGVGFTDLPKNLTLERHRGEATDFAVAIFWAVVQNLADEHVDLAVPVQVSEADVAAHSEVS